MKLDFQTGRFSGGSANSSRMLHELLPIFASAPDMENTLVYETFGCPSEVEGPARLLYATTVIQPGDVGGEYFMTRGHFHTRSDRGELMFTLEGQGALILMDRKRTTWLESMEKGSTHDIDGNHAHRVANTGPDPLVFLVAWMSDCGHDYDEVMTHGFSKRLMRTSSGPRLVG